VGKTFTLCDIILFRPRTIDKSLVKLTALASGGAARTGLKILRKVGQKAEARYKNIIEIKDIEKAISEVSR